MTTKALIKELKKYPKDMKVVITKLERGKYTKYGVAYIFKTKDKDGNEVVLIG